MTLIRSLRVRGDWDRSNFPPEMASPRGDFMVGLGTDPLWLTGFPFITSTLPHRSRCPPGDPSPEGHPPCHWFGPPDLGLGDQLGLLIPRHSLDHQEPSRPDLAVHHPSQLVASSP